MNLLYLALVLLLYYILYLVLYNLIIYFTLEIVCCYINISNNLTIIIRVG